MSNTQYNQKTIFDEFWSQLIVEIVRNFVTFLM